MHLTNKSRISLAVLLLVAVVVLLLPHREQLTRESLEAYGSALPVFSFIVAFMVLPLFGFPIGVFLFLVGIRFGFGGGMLVSAGVVFLHNVVAYRLAHGSLRERVKSRLKRAGYAIPEIQANHRVWLTLLFTMFRGPPYVAKLYLLALTDIPARIYLGVGATVHIAFCLLPVGAGSAVMTFDPTMIYGFIGIFTVLFVVGYLFRRRFRRMI
jgi:uncharacterized membrane protein YdjX (TVP38/TMEM64 family)